MQQQQTKTATLNSVRPCCEYSQNPHFCSDAAGTLGGLADEVRVALFAPPLLFVGLETRIQVDQKHKERLHSEFGRMPPKIRVRTRRVAGMCVDPGPIFVVDEIISFISAVGQFRIKALIGYKRLV